MSAKRNAGTFLHVLFVVALLVLCDACAAKYSMSTVQSPVALQWPYAPEKAKVTYVQALHGFAHGGGAGSAFRAIAGNSEKDNDTFLLPVAVAVGVDGRIAVADMGRRCVHLYVRAENRYLRLYGSGKEKIASPVSVVFDDELRLYLSDSTGKVFVFSRDGGLLFTLKQAGSDVLKRPTGLAYDSQKKLVYVVDTLANRVDAFNTKGEFVFSFGKSGEENGQFNYPTHIFWSRAGVLYVTDSMNFRIQMFDESGGFLGSFGHHGDGSGDLAMPKGVAVDKDGVIYVVDSLFDNVQLFDRQGEFLLTLGSRGVSFGEFWLPSGIFIDENETLYVCDTYNRRIQVFKITEHN